MEVERTKYLIGIQSGFGVELPEFIGGHGAE